MEQICVQSKEEYPIDLLWTVTKEQLMNARNQSLESDEKEVAGMPNLRYFINLWPNGSQTESRGEVQSFLFCSFDNNNNNDKSMRVIASFTLQIQSTTFIHEVHNGIIDESDYGLGSTLCKKEELFDPHNGCFVDGCVTIELKGSIMVEEIEDETLYISAVSNLSLEDGDDVIEAEQQQPMMIKEFPLTLSWRISKQDFMKALTGHFESDDMEIPEIPGFRYYIEIHPNGSAHYGQVETYLCFESDSDMSDTVIIASFTTRIKSTPFLYCSSSQIYDNLGFVWGGKLCTRLEILDPKNGCFIDDTLTIELHGIVKLQKNL